MVEHVSHMTGDRCQYRCSRVNRQDQVSKHASEINSRQDLQKHLSACENESKWLVLPKSTLAFRQLMVARHTWLGV